MMRLRLPQGDVTVALCYTLTLEGASPSNNEIKGMHFHVYRKTRKAWQLKVQQAMSTYNIEKPIDNAYLVVERYCSGAGLDWDNAYGGLKPILDCLVSASNKNPDGLGIILDDNPKNMPYPPYIIQRSAKRGEGQLVIKIYRIVPDDTGVDGEMDEFDHNKD